MMDVVLSVDVEVWCDGWDNIDAKFPDAFRKYIYGPTTHGDYGLPFQLAQLQEYGLNAVFFAEPLFSLRFGKEPLQEIVSLIRQADQEVQLHMHTEWVDEAVTPVFADLTQKQQHIRYFSLQRQQELIALGLDLLQDCGIERPNAFRAGSFAFNRDTLRALDANNVTFDSSFNASYFGADSGVMPGAKPIVPFSCENVIEYPMTVFDCGRGKLRHLQLGACSSREIEHVLSESADRGYSTVVVLWHNFECLGRDKRGKDAVVANRLKKLCSFLDSNRDRFRTARFHDLVAACPSEQPQPVASSIWRTAERHIQQLSRRRFI